MPKFLFTETVHIERENRANDVHFEAGRVYDLPHVSAVYWSEQGKGTTDKAQIAAALRAEEAARKAAEAAAAETKIVEIPATWAELGWPELLTLAKNFDAEARSKEAATKAIEDELARRAAGAAKG